MLAGVIIFRTIELSEHLVYERQVPLAILMYFVLYLIRIFCVFTSKFAVDRTGLSKIGCALALLARASCHAQKSERFRN